MTNTQQAEYLTMFDRVVAGDVYLKQWTRWRNDDDGIEFAFDEMPIPIRWREKFNEACPVQTDFTHAGWATRP